MQSSFGSVCIDSRFWSFPEFAKSGLMEGFPYIVDKASGLPKCVQRREHFVLQLAGFLILKSCS